MKNNGQFKKIFNYIIFPLILAVLGSVTYDEAKKQYFRMWPLQASPERFHMSSDLSHVYTFSVYNRSNETVRGRPLRLTFSNNKISENLCVMRPDDLKESRVLPYTKDSLVFSGTDKEGHFIFTVLFEEFLPNHTKTLGLRFCNCDENDHFEADVLLDFPRIQVEYGSKL